MLSGCISSTYSGNLYIDNEALDAPLIINRYNVDREGCEVNVTAAPVDGNKTVLCPPDEDGNVRIYIPDDDPETNDCCIAEYVNEDGVCGGRGMYLRL